jgi:3-hexulose-6-phosphate synthase/6-phospho-3-hexuloisomerase
MQPIVQLSLDLTSLDEALHVAEIGIRAGVDWLEAGTPLILAEGLRAVRGLRERFPTVPIVADLKTMDGGYLEAEMMAKAGANLVVVMGVAHPATIRAVVRAARDYGIQVMGDIMAAPDKVACAQMLEANGVDYIIVHTGFDERHEILGLSPLDDLPAIVAAVNLPVQAVGGLTLDQIMRLPALHAPLVVIGAPLAIADHAFIGQPDAYLEQILRQVVAVVHGQRAASSEQ